jgi:flavin-dependent dehydrogenase
MSLHHAPAAATEIRDVVVVGARVAGASTAMLLARQGLDVVIVDRAAMPSDTLSTHAIARGGVVQLARWGLLGEVLASGAPPIRSASFHVGGTVMARPIKDRAGVDHLLAPRRHVLDPILLAAAEDAGAEVQTGVSVTGTLTEPTGRVTGVTLRDRDGSTRHLHARFVVGADGLRSRIARSVGARTLEDRGLTGSTTYTYVAGLGADGFEFHIADRSFAGVFPTHGGEAALWLCTPAPIDVAGDRPHDFIDRLAHTSPELAARARAARVTSPLRTATGLPNRVLEAAGPGWALVGDAGYHRDPITGHGITDALRDAELLARRLAPSLTGEVAERDAMAAYAADRDRALCPIFDVTTELSQLPPVDRFVELQRALSALIDDEAMELASLPPIPAAARVAA